MQRMLCMDVCIMFTIALVEMLEEFVEVMESKSSQLVLLHVFCCMHACVHVVDELVVLTSFHSMGHCFNELFP